MRGSGLPRWFAVSTLLAFLTIASLTLAQAPTETKEPKAADAAALALDQKVMTAAKKDSEIIANLTYLSDMIGPRLTGSAAVKKANEWTADKMKSFGVSYLMGAHCTGIESLYRLRQRIGLTRQTAVVGAVGASFVLGEGIHPGAIAQ